MSRESRSRELAGQREQARQEAAKKQEAADLARAGELRTKKVTNRRGRQTGTTYEKDSFAQQAEDRKHNHYGLMPNGNRGGVFGGHGGYRGF